MDGGSSTSKDSSTRIIIAAGQLDGRSSTSKDSSTSTIAAEEHQEHCYRRTFEEESVNEDQVGELLVISISTHCNLDLFQSGIGSVWVYLDTGSPILVDCKFGSETVDEGDSGGRL